MVRPKRVSDMKYLCSGCDQDRYNHMGLCERPGIDASVTCDKCRHLEQKNLLYCRPTKKWVMSCHSGRNEKWLAEYARTGKKPTWDQWR